MKGKKNQCLSTGKLYKRTMETFLSNKKKASYMQ